MAYITLTRMEQPIVQKTIANLMNGVDAKTVGLTYKKQVKV